MPGKIVGAGDQHLAHRRDPAGDQRRIGQPADPDRQIVATAGEVDRAVVELDVELDRGDARARTRPAPARDSWTPKESGAGQADRPGDLGDRLGDHLLRGLELGEDVGGTGIIGLADVGRLGAARGAGEQARAELLLEPGDAARQDRLGQAHPFGGAGEGAGFHDPDEGEDVDEVGR